MQKESAVGDTWFKMFVPVNIALLFLLMVIICYKFGLSF